ncbi:D-isomer specific 2-hydroxyacid dehydrogenase, catalytic domain protein [Mycobacterium ulcerans str. Harvey]|uniref:D-isomer specific 2-hydroxyacid dehydrogenase, catalytic domain protein n=1 Tax=Mycobacterium ulcerans str. Harvey TaxID=1299332 RepID=A0ABN0RAF7_MYCUL|nr:D-isomer specific 2-hydroxyacid dehydrogenase, catalytic domain protein [Mycobacterium ulcerans str. Harvey]
MRSATTVDAEVLAAATKLKIVARAGVGLDNVDVDAATTRGVLVVNAPTSNIHSAAEHAMALLLAAARQIPAADASLREHTWKRSSFSGAEIFGKTVGVVVWAGSGSWSHSGSRRSVPMWSPTNPTCRPRARLSWALSCCPRRPAGPCRLHLGAPTQDARDGRLLGKEALAKTKPASSSSTPHAAD